MKLKKNTVPIITPTKRFPIEFDTIRHMTLRVCVFLFSDSDVSRQSNSRTRLGLFWALCRANARVQLSIALFPPFGSR